MKIKRFSKNENETLKEINEKLALLEEKEKEAKIREIEDKRRAYKAGIGAGSAGTAVGGGMLLYNRFVNNVDKAGKAKHLAVDPNKVTRHKKAGLILTGLGLGTLATSIAGNEVHKRKIKKVKDGNSEKK